MALPTPPAVAPITQHHQNGFGGSSSDSDVLRKCGGLWQLSAHQRMSGDLSETASTAAQTALDPYGEG
ncbi:hypothetical protein H2203_008400 [Taxawa tesnikishii (nom. ined.)]|nr:hypothetical protein H2203_008400 [Dothideales sp. JES 119]